MGEALAVLGAEQLLCQGLALNCEWKGTQRGTGFGVKVLEEVLKARGRNQALLIALPV